MKKRTIRRKVTFTCLGFEVEMEYDMRQFHKALQRAQSGLRDNDFAVSKAAMQAVLLGSIINWDVQDEDGKIPPISAASLDSLPGVFLNDAFEAIRQDVRKMAQALAPASEQMARARYN